MDYADISEQIESFNTAAADRALTRWNSVAKPIGSLGYLEDIVIQMAGIIGSENIDISQRAVVVFCADNGVVAEGVTQSEQDITTIIAGSIARHISSVCKMAAVAHIEPFAIDVGMTTPSDVVGVVDRSVARGTNNIAQGPAMTKAQALEALQVGIDSVADLAQKGYKLIATGEMGIGNTTTSSAVSAILLDLPVEDVTGRGAGLSSAGLERKTAAIKRAIEINAPDPHDPLDVLAKLGGFDIAALAGAFIGGALYRVPIIIDGFISSLAALIASRMVPACTFASIASHVSAEPAAHMILDELGKTPVIQADMRLGEGTGACCLIPLVDMALALYNGTTFDETGMDAYEVDLT